MPRSWGSSGEERLGRDEPQGPRERSTRSGAASGVQEFRAGDRVRHPAFGEGVVVSSALRSDDEEVTVAFPDKGVKRLMAGFAGLAKRP